jgi:NAD(P)-dependent dehydrogenase (short-subunit alcohol dehydrogenase family)
MCVAADIATSAGCATVVDAVGSHFGGVDIMVHVVRRRRPGDSLCSMTVSGKENSTSI